MPTTPLKKTFEAYTSYILGAALVFGGIMGATKGSMMSLFMGTGSGILMLVAATYTNQGKGEGVVASGCLALVLTIAMSIRYFLTGAALPGYVALLCGAKFAIDLVWMVRSAANVKWN